MGGKAIVPLAAVLVFQLNASSQYRVLEKQLTNITEVPASTQVVQPEILEQLGAQNRALSDNDQRFASLDQKIGGISSDLDQIRKDLKPVQDTDIEVHFLLRLLGDILGLFVATGGITVGLHYLREHWPLHKSKSAPTQPSEASGTSLVLGTVLADSQDGADKKAE